jgi:hypothetical protein
MIEMIRVLAPTSVSDLLMANPSALMMRKTLTALMTKAEGMCR